MPNAIQGLKQSYAKAKAAMAASANEIDALSKARLAALIALPPLRRLAHLTDPDLSPQDALALTRSLQSSITTSGRYNRNRSLVLVSSLVRRFSWRSILSPLILFLFLTGCLFFGIAARNTAHLVQIKSPVVVTWHYPSGYLANQILEPSSLHQLARVDGDLAIFRGWIKDEGYVWASAPTSILVLNAADNCSGCGTSSSQAETLEPRTGGHPR